MKIIFDHTHGFGKMKDQVFIYAPAGAYVETNEYGYALENGWCPLYKNIWFQTRSTRISAKDYKPDKKLLKKSNMVKPYFNMGFHEYKRSMFDDIYKKYIDHKKFNNVDFIFEDVVKFSDGHVYYTHNGKIVGFCFFRVLANNMYAVEFAWDYNDPKISLGKSNIHHLLNFCKLKKYGYLYLSSGYESCSIYKSDYVGFQWWTGQFWNKDVEQYRKLCYSDDKVTVRFDWQSL